MSRNPVGLCSTKQMSELGEDSFYRSAPGLQCLFSCSLLGMSGLSRPKTQSSTSALSLQDKKTPLVFLCLLVSLAGKDGSLKG